MKYIITFAISAILFWANPSLATSCEQIMLKAGYNQTQFKMLDEKTVAILRKPTEQTSIAFLENIKAPKCDFLSTAEILVLDGNITVNSLMVWDLDNKGNLKANDIIIPPPDEVLAKFDPTLHAKTIQKKFKILPTKDGTRQSPPFCGIRNGACHVKSPCAKKGGTKIEAVNIHVQCPYDVAITNEGNIIAKNIKAQITNGLAINNLSAYPDKSSDYLRPCSITADVIEGIGSGDGIFNSPKCEINAKTIVATILRPKTYSRALSNFGKISAQNVFCCTPNGGTCYMDRDMNFDGHYPVGSISTKIHRSCPANNLENAKLQTDQVGMSRKVVSPANQQSQISRKASRLQK